MDARRWTDRFTLGLAIVAGLGGVGTIASAQVTKMAATPTLAPPSAPPIVTVTETTGEHPAQVLDEGGPAAKPAAADPKAAGEAQKKAAEEQKKAARLQKIQQLILLR